MSFKFLDRVWFNTTTTGTGTTVSVGTALAGEQLPAAAGAVNGDIFPYVVQDGTAWEIGTATYNSAGPTITRAFIKSSTGSILNLSGTAQVFADIAALFAARAMTVLTLAASSETYDATSLWYSLRRSNSGSAMTDTLPTLTNMANQPAGTPIIITNIDATGTLTLSAGASTTVDAAASVKIPPGRSVMFLWDGTSNFGSTMNGLHALRSSEPIQPSAANGALTTNGNGTITAALIYGGIVTRSGTTAAQTDTTDTAAAVVAATPNAQVGMTLRWRYLNTGNYPITLAGGTGFTMNGQLVVPGLGSADVDLIFTNVTASTEAAVCYVRPALSSPNVEQQTSQGDAAYQILPTDIMVFTSATLTAPRTWTLPALANCRPGHEIIVDDAFAGVSATNTLTIALSGADTLELATQPVVFNGAHSWVRLIAGTTNWKLAGRSIKVTQSTSSFSWQPEPGMKNADAYVLGGGGSGGSGAIQTSGSQCSGGGGGGGGNMAYTRLSAAQVGTSPISVTVAAAQTTVGVAPTGATPTAGGNGSPGNTSSIAGLCSGVGGGGGAGGQLAGNSGGGGGAGASGSVGSATGATGGFAGIGGGTGGAGTSGVAAMAYGGGGGAGSTNASVGTTGGGSANGGGAGGGSGGGVATGPVYKNGGVGGQSFSGTSTSVGAAGTAGVAGGTVAGGNGNPAGAAAWVGLGGSAGGGGASDAVTAGAGGNGSFGSGGGGGGSSLTSNTAGAGGQGGPGKVTIYELF